MQRQRDICPSMVRKCDMTGMQCAEHTVGCHAQWLLMALYQAFARVSQRSALIADFVVLFPQFLKVSQNCIHLRANSSACSSVHLQCSAFAVALYGNLQHKGDCLPCSGCHHSSLACPAGPLHIAYTFLLFQKQMPLQVQNATYRIGWCCAAQHLQAVPDSLQVFRPCWRLKYLLHHRLV